jgi:hypothetical protein
LRDAIHNFELLLLLLLLLPFVCNDRFHLAVTDTVLQNFDDHHWTNDIGDQIESWQMPP